MKDKILFKDFRNKDKQLIWAIEKNNSETDTYKATIVFDKLHEIVFDSIPGQYVDQDGKAKKDNPKKLNEEDQKKLVDKRLNSVMAQLQQLLFTIDFYGGKVEGYLTSKDTNEKN